MVSPLSVFGIAFFAPLLFVIGFHVGRYHIRKLAMHGGEERYPEPIESVVKQYREEHKYELESLQYVKKND